MWVRGRRTGGNDHVSLSALADPEPDHCGIDKYSPRPIGLLFRRVVYTARSHIAKIAVV
jgi:hypothetical protein